MTDPLEQGPDKLLISVIIPAWNAEHDIARCLTALQAQTLGDGAFEVVVVDNGSTDRTQQVVRAYQRVRLIEERKPGSYAARNTGLKVARAPTVVFTDADCVPEPDWLETGLAAVAKLGRPGVIAGRVRFMFDPGKWLTACDDFELMFSFDQEKNAREGHSVTANFFASKALIVANGGFRSDLRSGGDFELSSRLAALGHPIVYDEDVIVAHPLRSDWAELIRKTRRVAGGQLLIIGRSHWRVRIRKTINTLRARATKVIRTGSLPGWRKARLLGLLLILCLVSLTEIIRVSCGRAPQR
jgi:glycosyltransferase involved in cell wall biosynthesis